METAQCEAARQEKSADIDSSIDTLERATCRLEELLNRVTSDPRPTNDEAKLSTIRGNPSLASILSDTPEMVRSRSTRIIDAVNALEGVLF